MNFPFKLKNYKFFKQSYESNMDIMRALMNLCVCFVSLWNRMLYKKDQILS